MNIAHAIASAKVRKLASPHKRSSRNSASWVRSLILVSIGNLACSCVSPAGQCEGRTWAAPHRTDLLALGRHCDGDLVEGRVGNLVGFNLWSSLNHSRQDFRHFGIRFAVVSFRVLSVIPQTDSERLRSAWDNECDFVAEPGLLSKHGKNVLFDPLGEFCNAIGFQLHGNSACNHVNLLGCHGQGICSDNPYWFSFSEDSLSLLTKLGEFT